MLSLRCAVYCAGGPLSGQPDLGCDHEPKRVTYQTNVDEPGNNREPRDNERNAAQIERAFQPCAAIAVGGKPGDRKPRPWSRGWRRSLAINMCPIVPKYVRHEHNISDRQGSQLSRRQPPDAATMAPGRPSQARAHSNRPKGSPQGDAGRLDAAHAAIRRAAANCLLPRGQRKCRG